MSSSGESISTYVESSEDEMMIGEAVALDVRPTGFVLRAVGALIDIVVYFGAWLLFILAITSPLVIELWSDATLRAAIIVSLVFCIVVLPMTVELLTKGRSLGKLAVGARIVRDDGGAIGFRHALSRALLGVIEIFMTFGGFAAIVALLHPKAKRLGDLLAGTYSQSERTSKYTPPAFGVPIPLEEWSRTADVAKMPDRVARRVSQFLANARGFTPESRAATAASLASEVAPYVSSLPAADPELFLAAVIALRRDREFTALQQEQSQLATLAPSLERMPREFPVRARRE